MKSFYQRELRGLYLYNGTHFSPLYRLKNRVVRSVSNTTLCTEFVKKIEKHEPLDRHLPGQNEI